MRQIRITRWDHRDVYSVQFFEVDDEADDGIYELKLRGQWERVTMEMIDRWLKEGELPGPRRDVAGTIAEHRE